MSIPQNGFRNHKTLDQFNVGDFITTRMGVQDFEIIEYRTEKQKKKVIKTAVTLRDMETGNFLRMVSINSTDSFYKLNKPYNPTW